MGGHLLNAIVQNQQASAHSHKKTVHMKFEIEIRSKLELRFGNIAAYRGKGRQTDRRTGWIQLSPTSKFIG